MNDLYVFAHPDDELMVAGRIQRHRERFHGVWLTNGFPRRGRETRERESRKAMSFLGIGADRLFFVGFGERELAEEEALKRAKRALQGILERVRPQRVYAPCFEGGHFVHDLANLLARTAFDGEVCEFPLYSLGDRRKRANIRVCNRSLSYFLAFWTRGISVGRLADPDSILELTAEELANKRRMKALYRSQPQLRFCFDFVCRARLAGREMVRRVPMDRNYLEPPRAVLLYELGPYVDYPAVSGKFSRFRRLARAVGRTAG